MGSPTRQQGRPVAAVPAWLDLDRLANTQPEPGWERSGNCYGCGTATFYPHVGDIATARKARETCDGCPVLYTCLTTAIHASNDNKDDGIWGRTSPRERRKIRAALKARREAAA